ncbi:MAG: cysteine desulfurase NifS [Verrucomicrobiae bacterium]|nr:cysteine desulfurase NifS [Verrucomicrobiae bacterium]
MAIHAKDIVYLDNNATTSIAPEVRDAMMPFLTEFYGNPSSAYTFGAQVKKAIHHAREQVAALLNCEPKEIIFTSCGTESDNTAIESALKTTHKKHIITTQVEHSAVLKHCEALERRGFAVTYLGVNSDGLLDSEELEKAIRPDTALVSIMWANNETGVLFPIEKITEICQKKKILLHTDAVQIVGKLPIDLQKTPVDFLSLSGHKLHAPKGVGALFIRQNTRFTPYIIGGSQEHKKRAGTENVASIVALGKAAELAQQHLPDEQTRVKNLRDLLENQILTLVPGTHRNGHQEFRLPNTSHIAFDGVEAEALLLQLDRYHICCSSGSACTTGSPEPSHVLKAMGLANLRASSSIRFSLSRYNHNSDIEQLMHHLPATINQLRAHSPFVFNAEQSLQTT